MKQKISLNPQPQLPLFEEIKVEGKIKEFQTEYNYTPGDLYHMRPIILEQLADDCLIVILTAHEPIFSSYYGLLKTDLPWVEAEIDDEYICNFPNRFEREYTSASQFFSASAEFLAKAENGKFIIIQDGEEQYLLISMLYKNINLTKE